MLRSKLMCLAVAFALPFLMGCKKGESASDRAAYLKAVKGVASVIERRLDLVISGDINVSFHGTQKMQFYARPFGPREAALKRPGLEALKQASLATVSTRTPFVYATGRGVIAGISVVGNYTGDGEYTINKRNLSSAPAGQPAGGVNLSIIRLELFDMDQQPPVAIDRIDTDEKPCRVKLRDDAKSGTLDCPLITDAAGARKVAIKMSWGSPK